MSGYAQPKILTQQVVILTTPAHWRRHPSLPLVPSGYLEAGRDGASSSFLQRVSWAELAVAKRYRAIYSR